MGLTALPLALALAAPLIAPTVDIGFVTTGDGQLHIAIGNKTDKPVFINLGYTVANGTKLVPSNLVFTVKQDGQTQNLQYHTGEPAFGGRYDDYIVPLAPHGYYQFSVRVSDFFDPTGKAVPLKPGKYVGELSLVSREPSFVNSDMQGVRLLKIWAGTVSSGEVELEHRSRS